MVEENNLNGLQTLGHCIWTIISTPKSETKTNILGYLELSVYFRQGNPDAPWLPATAHLTEKPNIAHLQSKDSTHSHQCRLASRRENTFELCFHHLPAPFHKRSGMGAKKHPQQKLEGRKTPTVLRTPLTLVFSLRNKLSLTDSVCFFLPPSDSKCKAGTGEDTSICSFLSLEWKCLLLFGQLWVTSCWIRPHAAGEKQRSWQKSNENIYVKSLKLYFISLNFASDMFIKEKKIWYR